MKISIALLLFLAGCATHSDSGAEYEAKIKACAARGMDWGIAEHTFGIETVVCDGKLGSRHTSPIN